MPRITYDQERRDLAFKSWRRCGRNLSETVRVLGRDHEWPVSRAAVQEWIAKYEWHKHADRLDAEEQRSADRAQAADLLTGDGHEQAVRAILGDYLAAHQDATRQVYEDKTLTPLQRVKALSELSVALDRAMGALAKASPDLSRLGVAKEVLEEMATFIRAEFPTHTAAFAEILEPFIARFAEHHG